MPQLYMIIPVGGLEPGRPDNSLPGAGWGGPVDPGWGSSGGEHPGNRPPGSWSGEHPGNRPPGSYPGGHPSQGPAFGPGHPSGQPIVPPQGGTDVPEDEYQPAPPPESITSQYIVSVWDPKTMEWTTKSYPPR